MHYVTNKKAFKNIYLFQFLPVIENTLHLIIQVFRFKIFFVCFYIDKAITDQPMNCSIIINKYLFSFSHFLQLQLVKVLFSNPLGTESKYAAWSIINQYGYLTAWKSTYSTLIITIDCQRLNMFVILWVLKLFVILIIYWTNIHETLQ